MDTIGFPTYLEYMKDEQQSRCIDTDADLFCVCCGPERSGKSLVVAATGFHLDPTYNINKVFYDGQRYTSLLLEAARARGADYSRELIEKYNTDIGVDLAKFTEAKPLEFKPGTFLHYDEAGSGMSNRESFKNIDQYKTLQCMGHLRMVNFWLAPKLRVIDVYAREERIKFFMWVDNLGTKTHPERIMFIWTKDSLARMLIDPYWKESMMIGTKKLVKKYRPDMRVVIPNLLSGDDPYVPADFYQAYKIRKLLFDYKRLEDSQPQDPNNPIPGKNEKLGAWMKRTGLGHSTYYRYKEKKLLPIGNKP